MGSDFVLEVRAQKERVDQKVNESNEFSRRLEELVKNKQYVDKRAERTEQRSIDLAKDVSDINTRILEIFGDKEFDQEKFEAESEKIVKFREEITKLRKQVIEDWTLSIRS